MKSPAIYNKANQTKLERYGNSIVTRLDWVKTKIRRGIKSKIFDKFIKMSKKFQKKLDKRGA